MAKSKTKKKSPKTEQPPKKTYPGRTQAYIQRRIRFAEAFCKTGNAIAAFLAVTPKANKWKDESIRRDAHTLLNDEITQDTIAEINELNKKSVIPLMDEVVHTLTGIMRGTLTMEELDKDGILIHVKPSFGDRLGAARQLAPLLQTRETLAAHRSNEANKKPIEDPETEIVKMLGLEKPVISY